MDECLSVTSPSFKGRSLTNLLHLSITETETDDVSLKENLEKFKRVVGKGSFRRSVDARMPSVPGIIGGIGDVFNRNMTIAVRLSNTNFAL